MRTAQLMCLSVVAALSIGAGAHATQLGIMSPDGSMMPMGPFLPGPTTNPMVDSVLIAEPTGGPIPGVAVPGSTKRWDKIIEWNRIQQNGIAPGDMLEIVEKFSLHALPGLPSPDITDWHEDLFIELLPVEGGGLSWSTEASVMINFFDGAGFVPMPGLSTMVMGPSIWFFFDSFNPNQAPNLYYDIMITKKLTYNGPTITASPSSPPIILILSEYPTPTPGALALLGVGGLAATRRRR